MVACSLQSLSWLCVGLCCVFHSSCNWLLLQHGVPFMQGEDYFAKELARLERMISSGSVAAAKLTEMAKKASVLGAFSSKDDETKEE